MKVIYKGPKGLIVEAGEGSLGSRTAGYVIESGTVGCVISREEAEGMSRALLDDLGLDHLARSLDLDRMLKDHEPRPEPSGGVAELTALMASIGKRLPNLPDAPNRESIEAAWLMRVMDVASRLYSTRTLNELGGSDPLIAAPRPKPVPDGVMRALYTDEEIAVLRSQADQFDQAALWQQCVQDAFALMHLVRDRAAADQVSDGLSNSIDF